MKLVLTFLLLCGVANANDYSRIQSEVRERITYSYYKGCNWDYIPVGQKAEGNCCTMAYNVWLQLMMENAKGMPELKGCVLKSGETHAFVEVNGWILDAARHKEPMRKKEYMKKECR